jgi:subtilisin family serine protease
LRDKLLAHIAIYLILATIFAALPVAARPQMISVGEVDAIRVSVGSSGTGKGTTLESTFNLDMINIENVLYDGDGVYVAVIDTGMLPHWMYYFNEEKIVTEWATAFHWDEKYKTIEVPDEWDEALSGHGTHVASTIIGYNWLTGEGYRTIKVSGVAPSAKIIPIKALWWMDEYGTSVATWDCIATAINYATSLAIQHNIKLVINLSLGGGSPSGAVEMEIKKAIKEGVIVVAAAGNSGEEGMDYPGAYKEVISAGWAGWTGQWFGGIDGIGNPIWDSEWWQGDVPEDLMTPAASSALFGSWGGTQVYVSWGSGREMPQQDLDVVAPGSWVYGPYWTPFWGPLPDDPRECYGWVGGSSMATPHVAGTAALMLQKKPSLTQTEIETILEDTAYQSPLTYPNGGFLDENPYMAIYALHWGYPPGWYYSSWADDAVGAGFLQGDSAIEYIG